MATTLPVLTRTIDDAFVTTWYEIRDMAIDNVLDAIVIWAALRGAGTFTPQVGGEFITRTVRYGEQGATYVAKGDTLPSGEPTLDTLAMWEWKHLASHVQRDTITDQKNAGPSRIKSYVSQRLEAARDGLEQQFETSVLAALSASETLRPIQSLVDLVPDSTTDAITGTYGKIARPSAYLAADASGVRVADPAGTNAWWGPKYKEDGVLASIGTDLVADMRSLYNALHANQVPPNLVISDQNIFETYEEFGVDAIQIIKDDLRASRWSGLPTSQRTTS
jgi:hypothetical protein